jgi:integrase
MELIHLEWQDVDIPNRRITIQSAVEKGGYLTKTGGARVVGISHALELLLSESERSGRYVFGGNKPLMTPAGITKAFYKLKKKAGLSNDITLHSLRHTYATHLMQSGVNPRIVQDRLGHKLFSTTWKYSHVLPSNEVVEDRFDY